MKPMKALDRPKPADQPNATASQSRLLEIDEESFRANYNRRSFYLAHHLSQHPLFSLPNLVKLANRLPNEFVKYNSGDVGVETGLYKGPQTGLSVEETIWQIEHCHSWLAIKFIEYDPEYRELLDRCLNEVQSFSEPIDPGMSKREGFIFISSPSCLTPYHMDPEINFLLQIRGNKQLHVFDSSDRTVLSEQEIEEFIASDSENNITYKEENRNKSQLFDLTPGKGLHIPITTPHWVQNGDEVSISFSITFQTRASNHRNIVYKANSQLRRLGLSPSPYGHSPLGDSVKFFGLRALQRAQSTLSVSEPKLQRNY